jgi:integrase
MAQRQRRAKGSGSIFRRGKSFVAQVQDGYNEKGKPKYRQVTCKSQGDAVKTLNELNGLVAAGKGLPCRNGHTVGSWLDEWLETHIKPNREAKTHAFYRLMVGRHITPHVGHLELNRATATDISNLFKILERAKATPSTIDAVRRTLRAAFGVAVKYGHVSDNPVSKTFAPRVIRPTKVYFDAEQVRALFQALKGSPIENLVRFALATGMRIGEVTGVTWDSVDFDRETMLVRQQLQRIAGQLVLKPLKTVKSQRIMPLVGESLQVLKGEQERQQVNRMANPMQLAFLNAEGRPFDPKHVNSLLHRALESAGLPKTGMHSLRHSAATFMLMAGLNLHQVSRYLGHSQITLTSNLYGHVLDGAMREAAERLHAAYQH